MGMTVDGLLAKSEEAPVIFMTFVSKASKYGKDWVYCFVEDYDMPYYSAPVSLVAGDNWTSIRCKGKEKVLEIHDYIKDMAAYNGYKKRFFVDRDFDDNSGLADDIYVTPAYSIENFYASERCMRKILETEYEIDPENNSELFHKTISHYLTRQREFHQATLLYNAWYACLHDDGAWTHDNISLGGKFPKKLLKYNMLCPITATYTLIDVEKLHKNVVHIEQNIVDEKSVKLATDLTANLRGKYEIEFVYNYIKFLNEDAGKRARQYTIKPKNFSFGYDVALSAMSQYADIPDSLKEYIRTGKR